jgi:hypothetical protein
MAAPHLEAVLQEAGERRPQRLLLKIRFELELLPSSCSMRHAWTEQGWKQGGVQNKAAEGQRRRSATSAIQHSQTST